MRPLGTRLGNIHFVICTFVLDIYCQQLGDICQLEGVSAPFGHKVGEYTFCNEYICIGYILPTIGGFMSVGGCLCALWAQGWKVFWLEEDGEEHLRSWLVKMMLRKVQMGRGQMVTSSG